MADRTKAAPPPPPPRPPASSPAVPAPGSGAAAGAPPRVGRGVRLLGMPLRVAGLCALLLAVFFLLARTAASSKSPTFDEPMHALGAWLHLHTGDFRVNPEDPPLWHYWAALPNGRDALIVNTTGRDYAAVAANVWREWYFTAVTLYRTPGNVERSDAFVQNSRTMMLVIAVALGGVLAWWAWRLGGAVGAVAATAAVALDPNFLAHGALVKNDVVFSLVVLSLALAIWRAGLRLTLWNAAAVCLLCGAGLNVKFSALLLGPITVILLVARATLVRTPWRVFGRDVASPWRKLTVALAVSAAAGVVGFVSIWACYGFRWRPSPDESIVLNTSLLVQMTAAQDLIRQHPERDPTLDEVRAWYPNAFVRTLLQIEQSKLLPQAWVNGLLYTYQSTLARRTYLLGHHSVVGWWYYFPVAMAVKTPLALLAAGALAIGVGGALARADRARRAEMDRGLGVPPERSRGAADRRERSGGTPGPHAEHAPRWYGDEWLVLCLTVPPGVYFLSAVTSNLNLGLRHVLPVYPFIYLGIGLAAAAAWRRWGRAARVVSGVLLVALAAESFAAFPNYLAFFNAAAGGSRNGIYLLADSNLDWGQDLKELRQWRDANPGGGPVYLSYFGTADPAAYGIDYVSAIGNFEFGPPKRYPSEPGLWVMSATALQGIYVDEPVRSFFADWFRTRAPIAVLGGGTIYVYKFRGAAAEWGGPRPPILEAATTATAPAP